MKIIIDNVTYTEIKSINFSTQNDVNCQELPINEFSATIKTADNIAVGQYARLTDNEDVLWANYWIVASEKYDTESYTITCQSALLFLERKTLPAIMYEEQSAYTLITNLFLQCGLSVQIDAEIADVTINGYCPEQTYKERLQWLCFVSFAYVQTDFTEIIKIKYGANYDAKSILSKQIYYHPSVQYNDWVTGIRLSSYSYYEGTPTSVDEYVNVNDVTYIQVEKEYEILNPNIPATAPENYIEFKGITLINSDNRTALLNNLVAYYFNRTEVTADIINNGDYHAGDKCILSSNTSNIITGYIHSTDFSFGKTNKSTIVVTKASTESGIKLTLIYMCDLVEIGRDIYYFPSGFTYSIDNNLIEITDASGEIYKRTIYNPINDFATGVMENSDTTNTQKYVISLMLQSRILKINIVDELNLLEEGVLSIK